MKKILILLVASSMVWVTGYSQDYYVVPPQLVAASATSLTVQILPGSGSNFHYYNSALGMGAFIGGVTCDPASPLVLNVSILPNTDTAEKTYSFTVRYTSTAYPSADFPGTLAVTFTQLGALNGGMIDSKAYCQYPHQSVKINNLALATGGNTGQPYIYTWEEYDNMTSQWVACPSDPYYGSETGLIVQESTFSYVRRKVVNDSVIAYSNICEFKSGEIADSEIPDIDDPCYIVTTKYNPSSGTNEGSQMESITYFNGLGRPDQIVDVGGSPQFSSDKGCYYDLITPIVYDNVGRSDSKVYLQFPDASNAGSRRSSADTLQKNWYETNFSGDGYAYEENVYENSALNRIIKKYQQGKVFRFNGEKGIVISYEGNLANEVMLLAVSADGTQVSVASSYYQVSTLFKFKSVNEDGSVTIDFKDKLGRTVLERKIADESQSIKCDTYYVYDNLGRKSWVISPEGSCSLALGQTFDQNSVFADRYCYIYIYDTYNRVAISKLPGQSKKYYIYDKGNRLVLSQDGNMRAKGYWLYNVYDNLDRPLFSNIVKNTSMSRDQIQAIYDAADLNNTESPSNELKPAGDAFSFVIQLSQTMYDTTK